MCRVNGACVYLECQRSVLIWFGRASGRNVQVEIDEFSFGIIRVYGCMGVKAEVPVGSV